VGGDSILGREWRLRPVLALLSVHTGHLALQTRTLPLDPGKQITRTTLPLCTRRHSHTMAHLASKQGRAWWQVEPRPPHATQGAVEVDGQATMGGVQLQGQDLLRGALAVWR